MSYKKYLKYSYKPVKGLKAPLQYSQSPRFGGVLRRLFSTQKSYTKHNIVYRCDANLEIGSRSRWHGRLATSTAIFVGLPLLWAVNQSNAFYGPLNTELKLSSLSEILSGLKQSENPPENSPSGVFSALTRDLPNESSPQVVKILTLPPVQEILDPIESLGEEFLPVEQALYKTQLNPSVTVQANPIAVHGENLSGNSEGASEAPVAGETNKDPSAWVSITVKSGDNLSSIFADNGLDKSELHRILESGEPAAHLKWLRPGQTIRIKRTEDGSVDALLKEINLTQELYITRAEDDSENEIFTSKIKKRELDIKQRYSYGKIENSLFSSAQQAGLPAGLVLQLVQIFGWDIDFALDIQPGDEFHVLYEEYWNKNEKIENGDIIAARFINNGQVYEAVHYTDATGYSAYYSPQGETMQKAFLRTPVKLGFISSGFNLRRRHPVLNTIRAHKGVDYAAPRGTPIYATGSGKVIYKGRKGGYGKTVIIQHGEKYKTLYGHMSKYSKTLKKGDRIRQGQLIGYVGRSGLATGSHLHYEFLVDGVHKNPLRVKTHQSLPIANEYREDFLSKTAPIIAGLRQKTNLALAEATDTQN